MAPFAACTADGPRPAALFNTDETRLSVAAQELITTAFSKVFPLADDGSAFEDPNCGDVMPAATVTDLNGDGNHEVFVQWGSACTSGAAGRSLTLYLPQPNGSYRQLFGFPAFGWTMLPARHDGWPDLSFGGPGFCHPVWSWRAGDYEFKCSLAEEPGGCGTRDNICPTGG